jgi:hypothetical protein
MQNIHDTTSKSVAMRVSLSKLIVELAMFNALDIQNVLDA